MNPIRRALFERLSADTQLAALLSAPDAIYHGVAPASAAFPLVVLDKQAGTPTWQFAGGQVQSDVWLVKGVDRGSSANRVEDIAARVAQVLTDAPLVVAGRFLLAVYREADIDYDEIDSGATYHHAGATFRIVTAPA